MKIDTMSNTGRTTTAAIAAIILLLLIAGCSSAPRKYETRTAFYPGPPETPKIQYLTAITSEEDIGVERDRSREFVTGKTQPIMVIARPWDLDHTPGKLYVSDKAYRRIVIVDLANKRMEFVDNGAGGVLINPGGIFVDVAEYKYIADRDLGQILVFDQTDTFVRVYEAGPEFQPTDVVVFRDRVYAVDVSSETITIFDRSSGDVIERIGGQGEAEGTFRFPTHLTVERCRAPRVSPWITTDIFMWWIARLK